MKKFLEDLETELTNKHLSKAEIEDIIKDHEQMINEAIQEGLTEEEITQKFGTPEKIAEDCSEFTQKESTEANESGYRLYKSFPVLSSEYDVLIHFLNEDFEIVRSESDQIQVLYKGKDDLSKYTIDFENDTLTIKGPKSYGVKFFSFRSSVLKFIVKLPDKYIRNFNIHSVDSDATVADMHVGNLELKTTNGDFSINNVSVKALKMDTVNGDVQIDHYTAEEVSFSTISGDVKMNDGVVKGDFRANSVSGDLTIQKGVCQLASFTTVSGDIDGIEFYPSEVSLRSVNGDITIKNTDRTRPINIISKKTVSGDIKIV